MPGRAAAIPFERARSFVPVRGRPCSRSRLAARAGPANDSAAHAASRRPRRSPGRPPSDPAEHRQITWRSADLGAPPHTVEVDPEGLRDVVPVPEELHQVSSASRKHRPVPRHRDARVLRHRRRTRRRRERYPLGARRAGPLAGSPRIASQRGSRSRARASTPPRGWVTWPERGNESSRSPTENLPHGPGVRRGKRVISRDTLHR